MELTEEEATTLSRWAQPSSPQLLALRSWIVLACAEGKPNNDVAAEVGDSRDNLLLDQQAHHPINI